MQQNTQNKYYILGFFICALAALFYVYDFVLRIIPGTIFPVLMHYYSLNAAALGLLSSYFFISYSVMQIPCGLLYDRFGPRRILTLACFVAAVATYFFLATSSFEIASLSRFFMGFGSAFAYIGALVLVSHWLPGRYYVLAAGIIQFMGSIGAILGEAPVAALVHSYGALAVINVIALIGLILTVLFWLFIRDYPPNATADIKNNHLNELTRLRIVLKKPQNWFTGLYAFCIWAPISVFAALWAVPFFSRLENVSIAKASFLTSFIWVGVAIGGPTFGWMSNYLKSRRKPLIIASVIGFIASLLIFYLPSISIGLLILLSFAYGFASSAQAVTFGLVHDNNRQQVLGTAAGFNNMVVILGGVFFQPIAGLLLQWHWKGTMDTHHLPFYSHSDFQFALTIIPLCYLLSFIAAKFFIKETHGEITYTHHVTSDSH